MKDKKGITAQKISLLLGSIVIALICGELLIRTLDLDFLILKKTLYYQCYCLPLHKVSENAERLYELMPNSIARKTHFTHPKENKYKEADVYINALGFRGQNFSSAKKKGVFRIVIFGGSNTFGPSVRDDDTYPAQMQKIFDEKFPGKIEVWNAGISAYVMSQNVAYAETVLRKYDPDLLIFQDTNHGRRAFLNKTTVAEFKSLFNKNKELFIENIPFWGGQYTNHNFFISIIYQIHKTLAVHSGLYRSVCLGIYFYRGVFFQGDPACPVREPYVSLWNHEGEKINKRDTNFFIARHPGKKIIIFYIPNAVAEAAGYIKKEDYVAVFFLSSQEKPLEYQALHPPSYVYSWYAKELCDFLISKGYLTITQQI